MTYLTPLLLLLPLVSSLTYSTDHSFRGSIPHHASAPENYHISGHSSTLPGVNDYLRLVPPMPLAFGGLFAKKPMLSDEWVVEVAFRVHGRNVESEEGHEGHQGGRGLAFWYTKTANPTPITGSFDPKEAIHAAPPYIPVEHDPLDPMVSLFGNKISFDGLAIIFDTAPSSPLLPRSIQDNDEELYTGAAVVSGIMDDGTGKWLDVVGKDGRVVHEEKEEASYLARAVGACEAAFRNTDGVLFARISHVNQSLKVELDLTPHTSLAVAGRHYAHTCFTLEGIHLPKGGYFGVSGLNSAGAEPDSVDIYSMEVFEVIKKGKDKIEEIKLAPEIHRTKPLDGTQKAKDTHSLGKLTHELFLAQARQVEATDDLARRLDALILAVKPQSLDAILTRLTQIELGLHANVAEVAKGQQGNQRTDSDVLAQLLQFQERLMVEIKGLNRKIDGSHSATTASLQSISTRHEEHTNLLQEVADTTAASTTSIWWYLFGLVAVGAVLLFLRTRGDGGFSGKKMI